MNLPFDTVGLDAAGISNLTDTYEVLSANYNLDNSCREKPALDNFDLIRPLRDPNRNTDFKKGGILGINTPINECYLIFLKLRFYSGNKARSGEGLDYFGYQVCALVRQKKDFGRALIRRETFTDRVLSVIHPVQLEFEDDKAFDKKYYVVANEPEKTKNAMGLNFRNALLNIDLGDFCIETNGNELLISLDDGLCAEHALRAAEIAYKLAGVR